MGLDDVDTNEALPPAQARKLITKIMVGGDVIFTAHARREMSKDRRTEEDARNVLRAGHIYEPAEYERDAWRYRVHTPRFCVVVEFDTESMMVVVTFWEKQK